MYVHGPHVGHIVIGSVLTTGQSGLIGPFAEQYNDDDVIIFRPEVVTAPVVLVFVRSERVLFPVAEA